VSGKLWVGPAVPLNPFFRSEIAHTYIWVVPGDDPFGKPGEPQKGQHNYVWTTVTNLSGELCRDARIEFYATPWSFFNQRAHATHIGTSYVDIPPNQSETVLCLSPWVPTWGDYPDQSIFVELHHYIDPLPAEEPTFFSIYEYSQVADLTFAIIPLPYKQPGQLHASLLDVPPVPGDARVRVEIVPSADPPASENELKNRTGLAGKHLATIAHVGLAHTPTGDNGKWRDTSAMRVSNSGERIYVIASSVPTSSPHTYQIVRVIIKIENKAPRGVTFAFTARE
jgi:hypothetical protein